MEDTITFVSTGRRDSLSCGQSIKLNIYFPVIDHLLSEFDRRFSASNLDIMKSLDGCNPLSSKFLDSALLSTLALKYNLNHEVELLPTECLLAKRALQKMKKDQSQF
uniref:Uncharacterized protein n=1 Tax=Amphimedon queenslandica TaxID=400682 RepID=A0A1X7V429_AMPQE